MSDKDLSNVIDYYAKQIVAFVEDRVSTEGIDEGIEMDIILRALFLEVAKMKKNPKYKNHSLEWLITKSFNEYASIFNLNMYAKDYEDPEKNTQH